MNKFSSHIGLAIFLPTLIMLGAGCSEKIAQKATEKALESATGNQVKVDTNNDGGIKIKGKDGSFAVGGGGGRPDSAPEDMPSVPGAKNFFWVGSADSGMLSFEVAGNDYRAACASQLELLAKAGWEKSNLYEMEVEKMMTKSMVKTGLGMSITCADNTDEGSTDTKVSIVLNKNKR